MTAVSVAMLAKEHGTAMSPSTSWNGMGGHGIFYIRKLFDSTLDVFDLHSIREFAIWTGVVMILS